MRRESHVRFCEHLGVDPGDSISRIDPPDIPWVIHRIVTSRHYRASLIEIQREWAIDDVADAHQALDYFAHCEYVEMRALRKS
jgi:hypothetical protein